MKKRCKAGGGGEAGKKKNTNGEKPVEDEKKTKLDTSQQKMRGAGGRVNNID